MVEPWSCPACASTNFGSSVVCWNCGHSRPDPETEGDASTVDAPAVVAAGGIPGWTPPATDSTEAGSTSHAPDDWSAPTTAQLANAGAIPGWSSAAPPGPDPWWRRIPLTWLVVGLFILGGAVAGWYFNASRSATGEISRAGDLNANDLRVGDCFDLKDASADTIEDVRAVQCASEHEYELYFVGNMPDGAYPGNEGFESFVADNCDPAFATYVGKTYEASELDVYWLQPTDDAWRAGDHAIQCAVYDPNRSRLTQSLKGSQR